MTAVSPTVEAGVGRRTARRRPRVSVGVTGGAITGFFAVVAVAAPWLAPYEHSAFPGGPLEPPSGEFLLGTDGLGSDLFSQLVLGVRLSMTIAVVAGLGTLALGTTVGLLAGWLGGLTDAVLMRVVDIVMALPRLPLLLLLGTYLRPNVLTIGLVISITSWPGGARVIRSQVLSLREWVHLRASVGFGARTLHVLRRHVVPELGLILVAGLVGAAGRAIILEAGLAFLGFGDPTQASWGMTLRNALNYPSLFFTEDWEWWLLPPIAAISLVMLGITLIGISVEERINPRLSRHSQRGRR